MSKLKCKEVLKIEIQIINKGFADKEDISSLSEYKPYIYKALESYFKDNFKSLSFETQPRISVLDLWFAELGFLNE